VLKGILLAVGMGDLSALVVLNLSASFDKVDRWIPLRLLIRM